MNTQIETVEEAVNRLRFVRGRGVFNVSSFVEGANWQKQQDEAKYKELLDSHNELLKTLENSRSFLTVHFPETIFDMVDKTINKAKNIINVNCI